MPIELQQSGYTGPTSSDMLANATREPTSVLCLMTKYYKKQKMSSENTMEKFVILWYNIVNKRRRALYETR